MATTYLTDTQGTPTNNIKWTWSSWIKRGALSGAVENIFTTYVDASNLFYIRFEDTDDIYIRNIASVGTGGKLITNAKYRDPAAWYHIVFVYDSANASAGDRMRLYVNGVEETSFSLDTNPSSSQVCTMNADTRVVELGRRSDEVTNFTGILAHTHFCDGQAYAASDFGETDATSGIWIAKTSPSVTYGDNGFFLKFASGALGTDSSGESNDFTVSGTMTNTKDTPDNNFCTWTPLLNRVTNASTFTNANTTVKNTNANWGSLGGSLLARSGKWYYEAIGGNTTGPGYMHYGFCSTEYFAQGGGSGGVQGEPSGVVYKPCYTYYGSNGNIYYATNSAINQSSAYGATYANTDYIGVFLDLDNLKMYWSKNGAIQNSGTGMTIDNTNSDFWTPVTGTYVDATGHDTNFGNGVFGTTSLGGTTYSDANSEGIFKYSPNDGGASSFDGSAKNFYALCTNNIKLYGG